MFYKNYLINLAAGFSFNFRFISYCNEFYSRNLNIFEMLQTVFGRKPDEKLRKITKTNKLSLVLIQIIRIMGNDEIFFRDN